MAQILKKRFVKDTTSADIDKKARQCGAIASTCKSGRPEDYRLYSYREEEDADDEEEED